MHDAQTVEIVQGGVYNAVGCPPGGYLPSALLTKSNGVDMGRPVVHWELWSKDPNAVTEFYRNVFDWQAHVVPDTNYHFVDTGGEGGINGGVMKPDEGPWPSTLTFYIDVDDIDAYVQRIRDEGGTIIVDRMEVPGMGWMALFKDPDERVIGMWQQLPQEEE